MNFSCRGFQIAFRSFGRLSFFRRVLIFVGVSVNRGFPFGLTYGRLGFIRLGFIRLGFIFRPFDIKYQLKLNGGWRRYNA